jgi:hypothetical protein
VEQRLSKPSSSSLLQGNNTERLSYLSVASASTIPVCDPLTQVLEPSLIVTDPFPAPITTYVTLGTDKNILKIPASKSSFHSVAALKSVQILSKFWGDVVDEAEEVIEDTISHDKRLEMVDYPSLSEIFKTERKKKKHVNKVMPSSFNSAGMRTHAQKGNSKAALADTE